MADGRSSHLDKIKDYIINTIYSYFKKDEYQMQKNIERITKGMQTMMEKNIFDMYNRKCSNDLKTNLCTEISLAEHDITFY